MSFRGTFFTLGFFGAEVSALPAALSAALSAARPLLFHSVRVFDGAHMVPKLEFFSPDNAMMGTSPTPGKFNLLIDDVVFE